jgi:hypothetical protein
MKRIFLYTLLILLVASCSKEAAPDTSSLTYGPPYTYANTPLGQRLQAIYDRTGAFILYQDIKAQDWTWNFDKSSGANWVANGVSDAVVNMPAVLDYLEQYWFRFYSQRFLQSYLPFRIIVSDSLVNGTRRYQILKGEGMQALSARVVIGETLPVGKTIAEWADSTKKRVSRNLHELQYLETVANKLVNELPDSFFVKSAYDYTISNTSTAKKDPKELGFWNFTVENSNAISPARSKDVFDWLKAIAANKPESMTALFTYTLSGVPVVSEVMQHKYRVLQMYLSTKYQINIHDLNALYF